MKVLGGFSLLAILVAVVVVLSGTIKEAQTFLGPGGTSVASILKTPIGRAEASQADQIFGNLYDDAHTETALGPMTSAQLVRYLQGSEPTYDVGMPGGVSATIISGDFVFCQSASYGFNCGAGNVDGAGIRFASGATLGAGESAAIAAAKTTSAGALTPDTSSGPGLAILRKARRAAKAGG